MGGGIKTRSQRCLAEIRAISSGQSQLSVWQALQREKQYQRNRVKKLDAALLAVQEGRALPENDEMQWPGGARECGVRKGRSAPSELFCQSVAGQGRC
eukprot:6430104-Alexandrium_andersonii.AAC.1